MSPVHVPLENQAVHIYIHAYMHVHTRELSSFHCLDICVSVCRYVCVCVFHHLFDLSNLRQELSGGAYIYSEPQKVGTSI